MIAVHRADHHALEEQSQACRERHRREQRRTDRGEIGGEARRLHVAPQGDQHRGRGVGADRDEGAVGEVHDVHQAEHQRQPGGHDEDHHPHGEARDGERDPGGAADERQRDEGDRGNQRQW